MITAEALHRRLAALEPIGRSERGTNRLAWTSEDAAAAEWFRAQAGELGLAVERDPAGNLWACPEGKGPWWGVGSHLDSVRDGGGFDGALGVAAAFEIARLARRPIAVISFADEEGARFNTPTFGSRALVGRMDHEETLARRDDAGTTLAGAMREAGLVPGELPRATEWLTRLRGFLELHIDQTTDVAAAGVPAGVVAALASRLRLRAHLAGRADHAGTTQRRERRDALAAAARLIVAAEDSAAGHPALLVTASRILVSPNALTTVPAEVRLWLDARAPGPDRIDAWHESLRAAAASLEQRTGVGIELTVAARSAGVAFSEPVRARLRAAAEALHGGAPELTCYAGHDAGVIAERLPAGMVLVRNPSGISHSPHEDVALDDAAAAANVVLRTLDEL